MRYNIVKQEEHKAACNNLKRQGLGMEEGKHKLSAKVVSAMLEAIARYLETTRSVEKTLEMIREMQKRLSA